MKNLKKLNRNKLKAISGGISYPFPGDCVYICSDGITYRVLCRNEFICPDGEDPVIH